MHAWFVCLCTCACVHVLVFLRVFAHVWMCVLVCVLVCDLCVRLQCLVVLCLSTLAPSIRLPDADTATLVTCAVSYLESVGLWQWALFLCARWNALLFAGHTGALVGPAHWPQGAPGTLLAQELLNRYATSLSDSDAGVAPSDSTKVPPLSNCIVGGFRCNCALLCEACVAFVSPCSPPLLYTYPF